MMTTGDVTTARQSLAELAEVLEALTTALESGRDDRVLPVEPRLAAAIDAVRRQAAGANGSPAFDQSADRVHVAALAAAIRDRVSRCRRLGGTVPALLSVMFPGRSTYGPDGRRREI